MTTDQDAGAAYGIQGFPTIKFFGFDKSKPADYSGQRDDASIVSYALDKVGSEVRKRQSGKGGASSGSSSGSGAGSKKKDSGSKSSGPATDKDVVILTASNFDD